MDVSSAKRVLGIEGGGSKTDWVFLSHSEAQKPQVISKGQLPASNFKLTPQSELRLMLQNLPKEATHVGIYLAGIVTAQDRISLLEIGSKVWPEALIRVGSDRDSALQAALGDADGITVISGTGSAVTGRKAGKIEKAGGRGHLLGDRGGAYVICVEGLRLALRTYDLEHRTSPMAQAILRDLSLSHMEELMNWVQAADKTAISRLSPVLFSCATHGDREMMSIIEAGALALVRYTESVARWLQLDSPTVKLLGGIFLNQPVFVELYKKGLAAFLPGAKASLTRTPGCFGAATLAANADYTFLPGDLQEATHEQQAELERASTEQQNPRSAGLEKLNTAELVRLLINEETFVVDALNACAEQMQGAVDLTVSKFKTGGRLFYVGAGTSGRLGVLDASEIPPTFGESPERVQGIIAGGVSALYKSVEGAEDDRLQGAMAVRQRGVSGNDIVCGITASGRTPFVLGALQEAKTIGAGTMFITCNPLRDRTEKYDVEIDLPTGPEVVTGSTRLKAGTATKVTLNILTTCSMIRLGKTRGNWMVELKPSNAKMRYRSIRLVSQAKGVSPAEAEKLLENADWNIRTVLS